MVRAPSLGFVALTIGIGLAGIANASNVTSVNPQSIVVALQNAGYKADLKKDDDGDPTIDTASDGNNIRIVMTDCSGHQACTTTEFVGVWDCSASIDKCKEALGEFNNEESPAKAISENNGKLIVVYYYLIYDDVGISEALFKRNFESFSYYNSKFSALVGQKLGQKQ
jgi:hypothetical protein